MNFSVAVREQDGCAVVSVGGELDIYTAPRLEETLRQAEANVPRRLIVDLTRTGFMDSTGLSVLVASMKRVGEAGSEFALVCDPGQRDLLRVMEITGLLSVFTVHASLGEAGVDS